MRSIRYVWEDKKILITLVFLLCRQMALLRHVQQDESIEEAEVVPAVRPPVGQVWEWVQQVIHCLIHITWEGATCGQYITFSKSSPLFRLIKLSKRKSNPFSESSTVSDLISEGRTFFSLLDSILYLRMKTLGTWCGLHTTRTWDFLSYSLIDDPCKQI